MSEVTLAIGGRNYTVACAEGEEAHVGALGQLLDEKLGQLGGNLSPQEAQNLLFAGLFVADDLYETRKQLAAATEAQADAEMRLAGEQRETSVALAMRDELQLRITQLENEQATLQANQQRCDLESDTIRQELGLAQQQAIETAAANEELTAQIANLQNQAEAVAAVNQALEADKAGLSAKVERLGAMAAVVATGTGATMPDELAPALERFAQMLEECAEKLEGKAPAT